MRTTKRVVTELEAGDEIEIQARFKRDGKEFVARVLLAHENSLASQLRVDFENHPVEVYMDGDDVENVESLTVFI